MESLSIAHTDSYWSVDQNELVPTSDVFTMLQSNAMTSGYLGTGFSGAEYDEDNKRSKKVAGKVRKVRLRVLT